MEKVIEYHKTKRTERNTRWGKWRYNRNCLKGVSWVPELFNLWSDSVKDNYQFVKNIILIQIVNRSQNFI